MNQKQADDMASATVSLLKEIIEPLKTRHLELEQRIKQLESRPLLKYAGVWRDDATYVEGRLVTHKGGLWLACHSPTAGTPGLAASGWRLIVKSGGAV